MNDSIPRREDPESWNVSRQNGSVNDTVQGAWLPPWAGWLALTSLMAGLSLWGSGWGCQGSEESRATKNAIGARSAASIRAKRPSEPQETRDPKAKSASARTSAPARTSAAGVQSPALVSSTPADPRSFFQGRIGALTPDAPLQGAEDLDGDGRTDQWRAVYQGGSGFGGVILTLTSSRLGQTFTLDSGGSFGRFLNAVFLPPALADLPQMVRSVVRLLHGESRLRWLSMDPFPQGTLEEASPGSPPLSQEQPDGSFEWLYDHWRFGPLPTQAPFLSLRMYRPIWRPGPPRIPESQVALLSKSRGARVVRALSLGDALPMTQLAAPRTGPLALLAYNAHNHGPFREAARCGHFSVFTTSHGVAVEDRSQRTHSWAYVSTDVRKLRWRSIGRVECTDGLIVIQRDTQDDLELGVVDPVAGRHGRLPLARGEAWTLEATGKRLRVGRRAYLLAALRAALEPPSRWQEAFDLDGDGKPDRIGVTFTGGAHCCYRLDLRSSRAGRAYSLPFELDGGYPRGFDLGQPEQFHVADNNGDGLPDLYLQIATYNGKPGPIPLAWRTRWGIRTNQVVVSLKGGRLVVRDLE